MKQTPVYVLDLTKIDGRGDFHAQNAGSTYLLMFALKRYTQLLRLRSRTKV